MTEEEKIQRLNELLESSLNIKPLSEFSENGQVTHEMNYALAQMFAMKGFRDYLVLEMNKAIKGSALRSVSLVDMAYGKARALTLKEILIKAKNAFETLERVKKIAGQKNIKVV